MQGRRRDTLGKVSGAPTLRFGALRWPISSESQGLVLMRSATRPELKR